MHSRLITTALVGLLASPPAACDVLRDYQRRQLIEPASLMGEGALRLLLQLATGGGKTHEIAAITLCAHLAGLRVLILATRTRLVRQIHERLEGFGVPHGVIAAQMRAARPFPTCAGRQRRHAPSALRWQWPHADASGRCGDIRRGSLASRRPITHGTAGRVPASRAASA